jgi:hypothetical protein
MTKLEKLEEMKHSTVIDMAGGSWLIKELENAWAALKEIRSLPVTYDSGRFGAFVSADAVAIALKALGQ